MELVQVRGDGLADDSQGNRWEVMKSRRLDDRSFPAELRFVLEGSAPYQERFSNGSGVLRKLAAWLDGWPAFNYIASTTNV
jgi:hypothetical protein